MCFLNFEETNVTEDMKNVSPDLIYCEFNGRRINATGKFHSITWSSNCRPERVLHDIYEDFEHVSRLTCWRWIDGEKVEFVLPAQNWDKETA